MKKLSILVLIGLLAVYGVASAVAIDDPADLVAKKSSAYPANSSLSKDQLSRPIVNKTAENNNPIPVIAAVNCPPEAFNEAEVCGTATNDGCLMDPGTETFESISCGDIVCGTYWSDDVIRDLDWYELSLAERGFIKWQAVGEAPTRIWMYDGSGGCADPTFLASIEADPEDSAWVELELDAGTYWLVVGPADWYDMPCDGSGDYTNNYVAMVECELGTPNIDVTPDSIYAEALEGFTTSEVLTVSNIGTGRLKFTATPTQDFIMTLANNSDNESIDLNDIDIQTLLSPVNTDENRELIDKLNLIKYEDSGSPVITAVDCPPDAVDESEVCGTDTNGGCAMSPGSEAWETLDCNTTICGTVWSDGTDRDTDWYLLSLTESSLLNWSVTAEFPVMTILLLPGETGNGCNDYEALAIDIATPEDTASVIASLPAGDYWFWIGPTAWYNMPCDGSGDYTNDYVAEITCDPSWLNIDVVSGTIHESDPPVDINVLLDATELTPGTYTGDIRFNSNDYINSPVNVPVVFEVKKVYGYLPGDANMSAGNWPPIVDAADITFLVQYFRGLSPSCNFDGFYASADASGDCMVIVADVSVLVNYLRGIGVAPMYCPEYPAMPPTQSTYPECDIIPPLGN